MTCFCGGSQERPTVPLAPNSAEARARVATEPRGTEDTAGRIRRSELQAVVDAGLGRFLQGVDTEPDMQAGHFVGFRIRSLYPNDERIASVDLKPGDTVVSVNGQSIERPTQALQVFNGLRVASELTIEYLRQGQLRQLRFSIEDQ